MIRSKIEGQNLQYLKYGTSSAESLTLSFWIKSNKTGTYSLAIVNDPTAGARVVSFAYTIDSANTWEKKIITIPGDTASSIDNTNGEEFVLYWLFSGAGNFTSGGGVSNTWIDYAANRFAPSNLAGLGGSTADEVYMTGVQLEAGTSASDFEFLPVDVNLARCQRYYQMLASGTKTFGNSVQYNSSTVYSSQKLGIEMRTAPTTEVVVGSNYYRNIRAGGSGYIDGSGIASQGTSSTQYLEIAFSSNGTANSAGFIRGANASSKIAISSEL